MDRNQVSSTSKIKCTLSFSFSPEYAVAINECLISTNGKENLNELIHMFYMLRGSPLSIFYDYLAATAFPFQVAQ